jgi:membrane-associated phospholipid phosphatase
MVLHDPTQKFEGTISPRTEKIAKIFSLLGQPPFLALPVFLSICLTKSDDLTDGILYSVICFVSAVVIPVAVTLIFSKLTGNDDKLDVVNKEDRIAPMILGVIGYAAGAALLYFLNAPQLATVLMVCYAVVTAAMTVITPYWKISIHSCGVIGPSIGMALAFWPWGLLYFLIFPPVVWSRYVLKKHTPLQLTIGAVVGFILTTIIFWLML